MNNVALLAQIDQSITATPSLWSLGQSGFVVRFASITFYVDPCFTELPIAPADVTHADMILATSAERIDASLTAMLESSKRAKLILPKSAAETAQAAGIAYHRMTTTDSDLRIEYFKDNLYSRIYSTPTSRYPELGYILRFGRWTIYHGAAGAPYKELADRLRPFNVNVALLPIGREYFSPAAAAQLASDIGATWLVPYHAAASCVEHLLGHCPEQRFKSFHSGEGWTVPED
jgi:L-ascorbate metabolism protein UlaG (beta-lactamase superfamily)